MKNNTVLKVIVSFVILLWSVIIIYGFSASTSKRINNYAEFAIEQNSERIAEEIEITVEFASNSINEVANFMGRHIAQKEDETPNEVIALIIDNTPFDSVEFIRADGINMTAAGEMFDASDREYYKQGIHGVSGIWINYTPKYSDEALLNFYSPVYAEGEIVGVVTGYLGGDTTIKPILSSNFFGSEVRGILCDSEGVVITATGNAKYGTPLSMFSQKGILEESEREDYIKNAEERQKITYFKDKDGKSLTCISVVKSTKWVVMQIVPGTSMNEVIGKFSSEAYIAIFGIAIIFIIVLIQIIKGHKKSALMHEQHDKEMQEINKSMENEKMAMAKIHETIGSASWKIVFDDNGKISECKWSDGFRKLLGYRSENDFTNEIKSLKMLLDDEVVQDAADKFVAAVSDYTGQTIFDVEYLIKNRLDEKKWFRAAGRFERREDGTPSVFHGLLIDINEQKKKEEALEREQRRVINSLKEQIRLEEEAESQFHTLMSMSKMYYSMHLINLSDDSYIEYRENDTEGKHNKQAAGAQKLLYETAYQLVLEEHQDKFKNFVDLTTLKERMDGNRSIFMELLSVKSRWLRAEFILIDNDEVMFTIKIIDEEKRKEENLIMKSTTDEMTGLYNRREYDNDVAKYDSDKIEDNLVLVSFDLNGLKQVNDTLGHAAGDELILGATSCMKKCFGVYGKLYRNGGDEFAAILYIEKEKLADVIKDLDETVLTWSGKAVSELSVAYGVALHSEFPEMNIRELMKEADKRMYEAKERHYSQVGIDRRGRHEAFETLKRTYEKILKVNLTSDTYNKILVKDNELNEESGYRDTISEWLMAFGKSGRVYKTDQAEFLKRTDINYLRNYFKKGNTIFFIRYLRMTDDQYRETIMEMIPSDKYTDENQEVFLYVKSIG